LVFFLGTIQKIIILMIWNVSLVYVYHFYYKCFHPLSSWILLWPISSVYHRIPVFRENIYCKIGHKKRVIVITYGEFKKSNTQTWCIILLLLYTLHIHNTIYILSPIFHGLWVRRHQRTRVASIIIMERTKSACLERHLLLLIIIIIIIILSSIPVFLLAF